jgi:hypothetical protein
MIMLRDIAIVFESFLPVRFLVGGAERDVADFQQLRRSEKHHVGGIVKEGIDEAAFVHQNNGKSGALGLDGRSHSRWSGANYQNVK